MFVFFGQPRRTGRCTTILLGQRPPPLPQSPNRRRVRWYSVASARVSRLVTQPNKPPHSTSSLSEMARSSQRSVRSRTGSISVVATEQGLPIGLTIDQRELAKPPQPPLPARSSHGAGPVPWRGATRYRKSAVQRPNCPDGIEVPAKNELAAERVLEPSMGQTELCAAASTCRSVRPRLDAVRRLPTTSSRRSPAESPARCRLADPLAHRLAFAPRPGAAVDGRAHHSVHPAGWRA